MNTSWTGPDMTTRQRILAFLKDHPYSTAQEIHEHLGGKPKTVRRLLTDMRAAREVHYPNFRYVKVPGSRSQFVREYVAGPGENAPELTANQRRMMQIGSAAQGYGPFGIVAAQLTGAMQ